MVDFITPQIKSEIAQVFRNYGIYSIGSCNFAIEILRKLACGKLDYVAESNTNN